MQVRVKLFARARELVGADETTLTLPDDATAADLRRVLADAHPALASLLQRSAIAIDDEFAEDGTLLSSSSEVAILPPVSGGLA